MRKIITYSVAIVCLLIKLNAGAQNTGLYQPNLQESSNRLGGKLTGEIYYITAIANSNYFMQQEWEHANITLKNGEIFQNVRLRYNIKEDQLVAYNENNRTLFVVDKNSVEKFEIQHPLSGTDITVQTFLNIDSVKNSRNKYCELLYQGSVRLLIWHEIIETLVPPFRDVNGILRSSEYEKDETYFIESPQFGFKKVKLSNRSLAAFYVNNKMEIKRTLRKNKINIIDYESAIEAFTVLDKAGLLK